MTVSQRDFDRLVSAWCDGSLTDDDFQSLEDCICADEASRDRFLHLMAIHGGLSWEFAERPEVQRASQPVEIQPTASERRTWKSVVQICAAVALSLVFVVGIVGVVWQPWQRGDRAAADLPAVVRVAGDVHVVKPDGSVENALAGRTVQAGDNVTVADDDEVLLRYADGTEIRLAGPAELVVGLSMQRGKRLSLTNGTVLADVAPQPAGHPLIIQTPQTIVRVLGTRFELSTDENESQLHLEEGRVELVRGEEQPVVVTANEVALVSASTPVTVRPRSLVIAEPDRRYEFSRLTSVGFSKKAQTIVGTTRWQAVYFYNDGRVEAIPLADDDDDMILGSPRRYRPSFRSGDLLAFAEKQPHRLVIWDSQSQQEIGSWRDFKSLPQRPDEEENTRDKKLVIAAFSPDGSWMATRWRSGRVHEFQIHALDDNRVQTFRQPDDQGWLSSFCPSPDGSLLAVSVSSIGRAERNAIKLVAADSGEVVATLPIEKSHSSLAMSFSADGRYLAVGLVGEVQVWEIDSRRLIARLSDPGHHLHRVAVSNDGQRVVAAGGSEFIRVWNTNDPSNPMLLDAQSRTHDLQLSPNGGRLAAVVARGELLVWNLEE